MEVEIEFHAFCYPNLLYVNIRSAPASVHVKGTPHSGMQGALCSQKEICSILFWTLSTVSIVCRVIIILCFAFSTFFSTRGQHFVRSRLFVGKILVLLFPRRLCFTRHVSLCSFVCLSVCFFSVCYQLLAEITSCIFMKSLPELYLWTQKNWLN